MRKSQDDDIKCNTEHLDRMNVTRSTAAREGRVNK